MPGRTQGPDVRWKRSAGMNGLPQGRHMKELREDAVKPAT